MKNLSHSLFVLFALMLLTESASAVQPPRPRERMAAQRILRKTSFVIHAAHKQVSENKNFTGDLTKAIRHQRFAKKLYSTGQFERAIHQSRVARVFAIRAIKANKGEDSAEYKFTPEDDGMFKNQPSDEELEKELEKEMPDNKLKDEDVIKSDNSDLDIK